VGGWLLVTAAVLSFGQGIIHPFTPSCLLHVVLAPAIGALVGVGTSELWRRPGHDGGSHPAGQCVAGHRGVGLGGAGPNPDFVPWLRVAVVVIGLVAVDGLSAGRRFPASRMGRRLGIVVAGALLTALAEPAAYAVDTAASPHGGTNTSRQIEDWVAQHFTGRTVDSVTLYDLTAAAS
jgi:hypothetical protein